MALEASHIRFALAIKDEVGINDINKYISGTIYPDSRYITKLDRQKTHPPQLLNNDFVHLDDFRKGWYVHLLYDNVLKTYTTQTMPELFEDITDIKIQGKEFWIRLTALKILQDIADAKAFDIASYLPNLNYIENPNNETSESLLTFNKYFQTMYAFPHQVTIESCYVMWKFLGVEQYQMNKLKIQTEKYQENDRIKEFLKDVFSQTHKIGLKKLNLIYKRIE